MGQLLSRAIQIAQQVRSLSGTIDMLELQANQLPGDFPERAEIAAAVPQLAALLRSATARAEQAKTDAREKEAADDEAAKLKMTPDAQGLASTSSDEPTPLPSVMAPVAQPVGYHDAIKPAAVVASEQDKPQ